MCVYGRDVGNDRSTIYKIRIVEELNGKDSKSAQLKITETSNRETLVKGRFAREGIEMKEPFNKKEIQQMGLKIGHCLNKTDWETTTYI